nr:MAG TPA: hypothetical protein [Caudoviricetes sp.]
MPFPGADFQSPYRVECPGAGAKDGTEAVGVLKPAINPGRKAERLERISGSLKYENHPKGCKTRRATWRRRADIRPINTKKQATIRSNSGSR